jgi:hypothetical protein
MTRVVVALFEEFSGVESAVKELLEKGFSRQDLSLVANDVGGRFGLYTAGVGSAPEGGPVRTAAGVGALAGGLGGVLVGNIALHLPGLGPVVVAGPLAGFFGSSSDQPQSGLVEALTHIGLPEDQAHFHAEAVRRAATLLVLYTAGHLAADAKDIMNRHNPVDLQARVAAWREEGWSGFDPGAPPLEQEGLDLERQRGRLLDWEADFRTLEPGFRRHYHENYASAGPGYTVFLDAYHLGYRLASHYPGSAWEAIEMEARAEWEREHAGAWEQVKEAARHGWEATQWAEK